ncbi:MAG: hypothetical protein J5766_00520, partial [Clostridia bacterium]|nr:hypothetical protein [Clostridia bacterium]
MKTYTARQLFIRFYDEFPSELEGATVKNCALDDEKRELYVELLSDTYIKNETVLDLKERTMAGLKLNKMTIDKRFEKESFDVGAAKDIVDCLRRNNVLL